MSLLFITILLLFYALVFLAMRHVGSLLPDQGSNLNPPHWKHGVLTSGLPDKSPFSTFVFEGGMNSLSLFETIPGIFAA